MDSSGTTVLEENCVGIRVGDITPGSLIKNCRDNVAYLVVSTTPFKNDIFFYKDAVLINALHLGVNNYRENYRELFLCSRELVTKFPKYVFVTHTM